MLSFTTALLAVSAVVCALATPTGPRSKNEINCRSTPNGQGTSGG
jgi:hypothetical protein